MNGAPVRVQRVAIGIGANLDDPVARVQAAMAALGALGAIERVSRLYRTQPWGVEDQPEFVNAVALLRTDRTPRELLAALKEIEGRLGRRPGPRWGPRAIDLDILTFGDLVVDEPDLRIPHPYLFERAFVLVPLAEVDARYAQARDALGEALAGVRPL
jgi:2-amino-4-hydroxy-6-hydroxymethyldihydropteridine diphosphokinase